MREGLAEIYSFGEWLKRRRQQIHLTQKQLATAAYCSLITIKKIEADERRPSTEVALTLAAPLQIPTHLWAAFVACARGERPVDYLYQVELEKGQVTGKKEPQRLPQDMTSFFGRESEIEDITGTLRRTDCRLLTLLGPGGIGKTRLAIEVARQIAGELADGAVFVNLSSISDSDRVPDAIAEALMLVPPGPAIDHLPKLLERRQILIVLDNCEQISQELDWLSTVLAMAPGVTFLATSREQLQLAEEWVMPVAGLAAAEMLFVETARRQDPDFAPISNAEEITQICTLVGNLPLAVKLAAGWTSLLSCAQIADQVQKDLTILTTTVRNVPPRHRSMSAVMDQSWQLLSEEAQVTLMRLSVFEGGWTAVEAETVAGANLHLLQELKQKSLVQTVAGNRFDLHSLVHQYAAEKLTLAGLENSTHRQHFETYLTLVTQLDAQLHGYQALTSLQRFWLEKDNIRAALQWSLDSEGPTLTMTMLQYLWPYWMNEGAYIEGQRWTEKVIAQTSDNSKLSCLALCYMRDYLGLLGEMERPWTYHVQVQTLAEPLADPLVNILISIGTLQTSQTIEEAIRTSHEVIRLMKESGEMSYFVPEIYNMLGRWLQSGGRYDDAGDNFRQSVYLYRKMGNVVQIAYPLSGLGQLALQAGDLQTAYKYTLESDSYLQAKLEMVPWSGQSGMALIVSANLALIFFYLGEIDRAEVDLQRLLKQAEETANALTRQQILCYLSEICLEKGEIENALFHFQAGLPVIETLYQRVQSVDDNNFQPEAVYINLIETCLRAALIASVRDQCERAITLYSTAESFRHKSGQRNGHPLWNKATERLNNSKQSLGDALYSAAWERGQQSSLSQALTLLLQVA